jgi:hypothetical protein
LKITRNKRLFQPSLGNLGGFEGGGEEAEEGFAFVAQLFFSMANRSSGILTNVLKNTFN